MKGLGLLLAMIPIGEGGVRSRLLVCASHSQNRVDLEGYSFRFWTLSLRLTNRKSAKQKQVFSRILNWGTESSSGSGADGEHRKCILHRGRPDNYRAMLCCLDGFGARSFPLYPLFWVPKPWNMALNRVFGPPNLGLQTFRVQA